ncbi:MAG: 50S ribosomal protein L25 [Candidatus Shikimatogenerans bostrichidophilus]|nr:MAG: 50S ribosomal protein L25 [Candidatus Shikimatogenerans bostrichidophilus]
MNNKYMKVIIKNRNKNDIPCIIYNKYLNLPCSIELKYIKKIISKKKYIINLLYNNKVYLSLIKDIQYNIFRNKIYHIDFFKIESNKEFKCYVNVKTVGTPIGITNGGICYVVLKKIHILTNIENYIDEFLIDISKLDIGDKIYIKDILKDNIKILHDLDKIVVSLKIKKVINEE